MTSETCEYNSPCNFKAGEFWPPREAYNIPTSDSNVSVDSKPPQGTLDLSKLLFDVKLVKNESGVYGDGDASGGDPDDEYPYDEPWLKVSNSLIASGMYHT